MRLRVVSPPADWKLVEGMDCIYSSGGKSLSQNWVYPQMGILGSWQPVTGWGQRVSLGWSCHESHPELSKGFFEASLCRNGGYYPGALCKGWDLGTPQGEGMGMTGSGPGVRSQPCHRQLLPLSSGLFPSRLLWEQALSYGRSWSLQSSRKTTNKCVVLPAKV